MTAVYLDQRVATSDKQEFSSWSYNIWNNLVIRKKLEKNIQSSLNSCAFVSVTFFKFNKKKYFLGCAQKSLKTGFTSPLLKHVLLKPGIEIVLPRRRML